MIGVTERAKQELRRVLLRRIKDPQVGLRLIAGQPGKMRLGVDRELPGDEVVQCGSSKVLLVEKVLAASLAGLRIDVKDAPQGCKLVIVKEPVGTKS